MTAAGAAKTLRSSFRVAYVPQDDVLEFGLLRR